MRTTLNIDDELLSTAKALAEQSHKPLGEVVSDLMRKELADPHRRKSDNRNGVPLFAPAGNKNHFTIDQIDELRDCE